MRVHLYRLSVGVAGLVWLATLLAALAEPLPWPDIVLFALFSWVVKRAGFRVAAEVTHSLVNVVDVAALLLLGPVPGALVSALGSLLALLTWELWREHLLPTELLERSIFVTGIRALMALTSGTLYLALGGRLAPTTISADQILPLGALFLTWFGLDHLLWMGNALAEGGINRTRRFLSAIGGASLLVELLPLPFSLVFVAGWLIFDSGLRALLAAAVLGSAIIVRFLARALRRSRERLGAVSLLSEFSDAVVHAQLDELRLSTLLFEYISRLVSPTNFTLLLHEDGRWRLASLAGVSDYSEHLGSLAGADELIRSLPAARLLPDLRPETVRAGLSGKLSLQQGRGLIAPLAVGDRLLGLFMVESNTPMNQEVARNLALLGTQTAAALQNARHYRQEQWRALQLQTIAEVSRRVASIIELDELLDQVVDLVQETFRYYHVQIYLVDRERNQVVFRAGSGPIGEAMSRYPPSFSLDQAERGIITWVATHAEPLLVNDVTVEPRYVRDDERLLPKTRAELAVPLKVEDRVLGVLDVQGDERDAFDEDDLFTLSTLADQVAIAIEDARLYAAQREETWVTTALLQVAEAVSPLTRLSEVLETVVRITPILTGASTTAIYLWREAQGRFELADAYGLNRDDVATLLSMQPTPDEFPLLSEAHRQQQLISVPEVNESELVPSPYRRLLAPASAGDRDDQQEAVGNYALVAAPLVAQGEAMGVMLLGFLPEAVAAGERRRVLIAGIAQQAAVGIQAARLYAAQRDEAWITTALLQVAEAVASRNDLPDVLQLIARLTVMLAEVERCGIYLWEPRTQKLDPVQSCGLAPEVETLWSRTPLTAETVPALKELAQTPAPIVLDGTGADAPDLGPLHGFFNRNLVVCPLRAHDQFLGLMVVDLPDDTPVMPERTPAILAGVARQISIAVENARLYQEAIENERRTQELHLARQLQTALLPERPPQVPGYDLAGYWRPAREVAGDFYDFISLGPDRMAVVIADVADKGMAAALFMVLARSALRESIWNEGKAGAALRRTNQQLAADARGGMFVSCFLALLSPREGKLVVSNAGHLPPLIYNPETDSYASFSLRNLPLGILADVEYLEGTIYLPPGGFVVLYTDGVTDTPDNQMRLFGTHRLADVVWEHRTLSAREMVDAIVAAVNAFAPDEQAFDDLTVVVVKREP